jgi:hypothetical protein
MWFNRISQYRLVYLRAVFKELLDDLMTKSGNQCDAKTRVN